MNSLNIKKYGHGENVLVAIHGLGSASSAWDLVRPELEKRFQFVTLDLPGHGDATMLATEDMDPEALSKILVSELEKSGITKFHLIGNSLEIGRAHV